MSSLLSNTPSVLASINPIEHVLDHKYDALSFGNLGHFSMQLVTLCIGAVIAILLLMMVTRSMATGPASMGNRRYLTRGRFSQVIEVMVIGLRDSVIEPILGPQQTKRYLPFLLTIFFFILTMNLLGLIPFLDIQHLIAYFRGTKPEEMNLVIGGTPTSNIAVNAALASVVFIVIQVHAFRELGVKGWFEHLCGGKDLLYGPKGLLLVVPILFVVEFVSLFVKPTALVIRLFANMLGGHTMLATLFLFGTIARNIDAPNQFANWTLVGGVSLLSGAFALGITFMEIFVAFLQAFVFMILTTVFISEMSHHDDHEHADDAHAHDTHRAGTPQPAHAH
jgi:F-type H+-transporting ATPase subunit a